MNSIAVFVVLCSLLTIQSNAKEVEDQGACLLQKGSNVRKALSGTSLSQQAHRDWRVKRGLMVADTSKSMGVLDDFIAKQQASGDHCSSRLVEAKRALDGLLKDLNSLVKQVDSQEEVLETETGNLNITKLSINAVEIVHKEAVEVCAKEKQDALDLMAQYQAELAELDQIAKPSVRFTHVTKEPVKDETKEPVKDEEPVKEEVLFQKGSFTKERCVAFLNFVKAKAKANGTVLPEEEEDSAEELGEADCDTQREELQKAFTESYISIRDLVKEAKEDSEDQNCLEMAEAKKAAGLVPLVAALDRAASMIETAEESLVAIDPVLDLVDERSEKMSTHIYDVLTPECAEAKEVSEALEKIRELILLLEECPGRNDFKLKIPEEV